MLLRRVELCRAYENTSQFLKIYPCARSVELGSVSAGLPCSWLELVIKCRLTRQLVVGVETLVVA